jgi:hypothetical protein
MKISIRKYNYLLYLFGITSCVSNSSKVENKLYAFENIVDLGKLDISNDAVAVFTLNNPGMEIVKIETAVLDCHCISINLLDSVVLPKGILKISVKYDKSIGGYFYKTLRIKTNKNQTLILAFKGRII